MSLVPPAAPPPPEVSTSATAVGIIVALFSGMFTALSMVINRYSLAHAETRRVKRIPFEIKPWMVWLCAMAVYNLGATVLASIAQLFIPLSLFASLFILLLVFNLFFARAFIGESLTKSKVGGAVMIIAGAMISATAAPANGTQLQELYRCTESAATEPPAACVHVHVSELAQRPVAVAWMATLLSLALASVGLILYVEWSYPARDVKRAKALAEAASAAIPMTATPAEGGKPAHETDSAPPTHPPPRLAPPWLERVMIFVYPVSMGLDEGIAHLWMRAETAMTTQCVDGGCDNGTFVAAACLRWGASLATAFWLVVVFRRYPATMALPIEYGTVTVVDVASGLIFYKEHELMDDSQLARVLGGCAVCIGGIALSQYGTVSCASSCHTARVGAEPA